MRKEFDFKSSDGKNTIYAVKWLPKDKPKYILQIAHGMAEHVLRYEEFANYLCDNGFLVCGEDHIGHGRSVKSKVDFGYCGRLDGHKYVVKDMKKLHDIISKDYPNIPYFLLGHSMGSFLCREYLETFGDTLSGAIVMGTNHESSALLILAKTLCRIIAIPKG